MNPSNQLTGVHFLEHIIPSNCRNAAVLVFFLYVNTNRSGESVSHWTINHALFLCTKSVICHEGKGMIGKARSPRGFYALPPVLLREFFSKIPQNKERKDDSSQTSLCDLYNLSGKLNLAGHIWSHFMDSFPCKKDWGLGFLDASVAVWNKNSRSFTALCFQIKIWIWKDKHVSKKKMKRDSFL